MTRLAGPIEQQRARTAGLLAEATAVADDHALRSGSARHLPVVLVPANPRPIVPMPPAARLAFLTHLTSLLDAAFALPVRDNTLPMSAEDRASRVHAGDIAGDEEVGALSAGMVAASCTACRGECCTAGGTHAFLRKDSVTRVRARMAADGVDSAAHIAATYADHLPTHHYRGSCVYHADQGCTLPRDLRSNLCNRYLCGELSEVRRVRNAGAAGLYLAAADDRRLHRVTRVDEGARGDCHAEPVPLTAGQGSRQE